jgi:MFS family permease
VAEQPGTRRSRWAPALRHRNFRIFVSAQAVSLVGTHVQNLAVVWLVLVLTGSPLLAGLVTAVQGIPIAVLALVGGVVADRFPKRRVLIATQGTMFVLALALGVLALIGLVTVWQVMLLALALGCANAIDMPARQALVAEMVGRDDIASAVGLNSSIYNAGRLVGPAVAGLVIAAASQLTGSAVVGTGAAFLLNAATFGAVIVGLLLLRDEELSLVAREAGPRRLGQVPHEIAEGLGYLWSDRRVLATMLVPGAVAIVAVNFNVLVPVYARETGLGAGELGVLLSAVGAGSLVSALWIGMGGRAGRRVLIAAAALLGATTLVLGLTSAIALWLLLLFGAGLGASAMRTAANTGVQVMTPAHLRGRVMGIFSIVFEGISPLGGLGAGALAAAAGAQSAFVVTGAGALLVLALGLRALL